MKFNRIYLYLAGCLFTVFSLSCGDDDGNELPTNELVGSWVASSASVSGCSDPAENQEELLPCTSQMCTRIEFTADGTYITRETINGVEEVETGTYTISGNLVVVTIGGTPDQADFSVSGNTLTLSLLEEDSGCTLRFGWTRQ